MQLRNVLVKKSGLIACKKMGQTCTVAINILQKYGKLYKKKGQSQNH